MSAEGGGAAGRDCPECRVLNRREAVRPTIRIAVHPHDVREFQPRRDARARHARRHGAHGSALRWRDQPLEQIERRARAHLRVPRQLHVARRRADVAVTEQPLNRVQVDAGFE